MVFFFNFQKFQYQMCVWVVALLHQRLKSTLFEIFSSLWVSFTLGTLHPKKFQKTLVLAFEANSALSGQNGLFFQHFRIMQVNFFRTRLSTQTDADKILLMRQRGVRAYMSIVASQADAPLYSFNGFQPSIIFCKNCLLIMIIFQ